MSEFGTEHTEQSAYIDWAMNSVGFYPDLEMLYAVPNGAKLPWSKDRHGKRFSRQAIVLKEEGLRPGVPDLCLPVPRGVYHGAYLETKWLDGSVSDKQNEYIRKLRLQGYCVGVCWGSAALTEFTVEYLNLKPGETISKEEYGERITKAQLRRRWQDQGY